MKMNEKVLPLPRPDYPSIQGLDNQTARKALQDFFREWDEVARENEERFPRALRRVRWCAFLRGFLNPFSNALALPHYSWCPFEHWMSTTQKEVFKHENR